MQHYTPRELLVKLRQAGDSALTGLGDCNELPEGLSKPVCVYLGLIMQCQHDLALYPRLSGLFLTHNTTYLKYIMDIYFQQSALFLDTLNQNLGFVEKEVKDLAKAGIQGSRLSSHLLNYPETLETWELTGLATLLGETLALYEGEGRLKIVFPLGAATQEGTLALLFMGKQSFWLQFTQHSATNLAQKMAKLVFDYLEIENMRQFASFSDYQYARLRTLAFEIAENADSLLNCSEICDFQRIFIHQLTKSYRNLSPTAAFPLGVLLKCGHWTSAHSTSSIPACVPECDLCKEPLTMYIDVERVLLPSEVEDLKQQGLCSSCLQVSGNTYSGKCGHGVCYPCVYKAFVQGQAVCKWCVVYAEKRDFLRSLSPIQCVLCLKKKVLTLFPPIHYNQNMVCYDCYVSPTTSPLNDIPLTPALQTYVRKVFFHCSICNKVQNRKLQYKDSQCGCEVCVNCMDIRMTERESSSECAECRALVTRQNRTAVRARVGPQIEARKALRAQERIAKEQQEKAEKELERAKKAAAEKQEREKEAAEKQEGEKVAAEEQKPPAVLSEPAETAPLPA